MRKGEKLLQHLYKHINSKELDPTVSQAWAMQEFMLTYLAEMSDEQFDKILNNQCRVCEQQRKLECCYDCYDEMRGEMLARDEYI